MLRDHNYDEPIQFVQWYSCHIHYHTVYVATSDVYPVLEVTEWSKNGTRRFRTDVVYRDGSDDQIRQRVEVLHRHGTKTDGARDDIAFLEVSATHVRERMSQRDFTLCVETVHAKECPLCTEDQRNDDERKRKEECQRLENLQRQAEEERHRQAELERDEQRRLEKKRYTEVMELQDKRLQREAGYDELKTQAASFVAESRSGFRYIVSGTGPPEMTQSEIDERRAERMERQATRNRAQKAKKRR